MAIRYWGYRRKRSIQDSIAHQPALWDTTTMMKERLGVPIGEQLADEIEFPKFDDTKRRCDKDIVEGVASKVIRVLYQVLNQIVSF